MQRSRTRSLPRNVRRVPFAVLFCRLWQKALDKTSQTWYNDNMTNDTLPTHALDVQLDLFRYYTRDEE